MKITKLVPNAEQLNEIALKFFTDVLDNTDLSPDEYINKFRDYELPEALLNYRLKDDNDEEAEARSIIQFFLSLLVDNYELNDRLGKVAESDHTCKNLEYIIKEMIENGANVDDIVDEEGHSLLYFAVKFNMVDLVKTLLEKNADINRKFEGGNTLLHLISGGWKCQDTWQLLFDHHPDVNALNDKLQTPLHLAAYNKERQLFEKLLDLGAKINAVTAENESVLFAALIYKNQFFYANENADTQSRTDEEESSKLAIEHYMLANKVIPAAEKDRWKMATTLIDRGVPFSEDGKFRILGHDNVFIKLQVYVDHHKLHSLLEELAHADASVPVERREQMVKEIGELQQREREYAETKVLGKKIKSDLMRLFGTFKTVSDSESSDDEFSLSSTKSFN